MSDEPIRFLVGARLYLRPVEESDLPTFQRWVNDYETRRYIRVVAPIDAVGERAWYDGLDRSLQPSKVGLCVVLKDGDQLIGNMSLHNIDWLNRSAETGALIGVPEARGKGYGHEAKELLLEYAFDTLNMHRISSHTMAFNKRSAAYLRRSGYVEEGRAREAFFRDGQWWDAIHFGLLRDEWAAQRGR